TKAYLRDVYVSTNPVAAGMHSAVRSREPNVQLAVALSRQTLRKLDLQSIVYDAMRDAVRRAHQRTTLRVNETQRYRRWQRSLPAQPGDAINRRVCKTRRALAVIPERRRRAVRVDIDNQPVNLFTNARCV